jgi:multidrug resistance efflux pump
MSPIPKTSAGAERVPDAGRPEVVAPGAAAPRSRAWLVWLLVAAALMAGAILLLRSRYVSKPAAWAGIRTARVIRGALLKTLRVSGSIEASRYADIVAPRLRAPDNGRGMVLLYLSPNGSMVKKGDVVAEADSQPTKDHLEDVEAQVGQGELEILRLKANQAAEMETVRQRVRVARGALEKAQQDVRAVPTKNKIDQELLKLAAEEAQARYDQAQNQVNLYIESHAAQLRVAELNQESQVRHRDRHRNDIERLVMRTPIDGRAVLRPTYRHGEQYQTRVGDEVNPGQMFMRVDASGMQLETSMNQAESQLLRVGQRATIRFDAYPDIRLHGKVVAVGTIAAGGRRVNYYVRRVPVRIALEGQDPRVLPDLTASADVVVAEQPDSIIVPREAVMDESGKSVVYVKQDGAFSAREVEIGLESNTGVAVRSGLQPGDEVALDRPL